MPLKLMPQLLNYQTIEVCGCAGLKNDMKLRQLSTEEKGLQSYIHTVGKQSE